MDSTTQAVTPLRQRMIEDMRMRKLELKTRTAYLRAVTKLATFLKRSPDTATVEEICVASSCIWWITAHRPSPSMPRSAA